MKKSQLIFIAGCNAAGKSSFIRTRISELDGFEIIMTDVYKGRVKEVFNNAVKNGKNIILETVFNDSSFKDLVDHARNEGYDSSLIALFLDTPQHSIERVAFRTVEQSGLMISNGNIRINFNESFKNIATYFFYFDRTDLIYTGVTGRNTKIMSFEKSVLVYYKATNLLYPQKIAQYAYLNQRMNKDAFDLITANEDFER
ncbi:zeta toxin family protein [Mucilaginibacter sp. Mucisp86]|uniref:zeta toxin family protein n=1 Tax=Mucilaginibacter sp. Mucisp86 TaxID=3243060 RepID=UPI0039B51EC2